MKAIILLSGGLDSTTCLAYAKSLGYDCHALSFSYGQRHNVELEAAKRIAKQFGAKHHIFNIDISQFGGSALTDASFVVPDHDPSKNTIPVTYVPARNTIFLSIALAHAEVVGASAIFIGVSARDYSGYPDCRPAYIEAFQTMANLATKAAVEDHQFIKIETPLIHLSKAETVELGLSLGVDYSLTVSCYRANEAGEACGNCDSCTYRKKGFADLGVNDPTHYTT
jgi:7-cyano-7-deazaguanine synthase